MLTGIVYLSRAAVPFDNDALVALAAHAQQRNQELEVTGYLYYEQRQFIQYIEGDDGTVNSLMERIAADERHKVKVTLHESEVTQRRFPDWSMRYVTNASMISLEQILRDHLSLVMTLKPANVFDAATVWRMVNNLSRNRSRILPAA